MNPGARSDIASLVALVAALLVAATSASGDQIPGAKYEGHAADGASIELTVSADGTQVDSYLIDARANPALGGRCTFHAEGHAPVFEGAAITNHSFAYSFYHQPDIQGTFSGAQSVTGWYRIYTPADSEFPACDTGEVPYTLTTSSTPPPATTQTDPTAPPDDGSPPAGPSTTPVQPPVARTTSFSTTVRLSRKGPRLSGRVVSSGPGCEVHRRVLLKAGSKTVATTRSGNSGAFHFTVSRTLRHRRLRVSIPASSSGASRCLRASSKTLVT
jgi:hypothetical protein